MSSNWWCDFVAGWLGGSAGIVVGHPADTVKVVQQAGGGRGILATIHNLWRTEGVRRGFFKGMLYPIVSNGAINSIFFGVYGSLLPKLQVLYEGFLELGSGGRANASQTAQFVFGGLAGTLCWLSVLPFDVVKSRMQATDGRHYTGMVQCARDSYRQEGAKVFMRGALAMSLRAFPVNGVTFLVYEVLLDLCQNR